MNAKLVSLCLFHMLLESWQSDPHTNTQSQVLWTELSNPQRSFAEARTPNMSIDEDVLVKAMKANGAMRAVWLVWKSCQGSQIGKVRTETARRQPSVSQRGRLQRTQIPQLQTWTPGHQSGRTQVKLKLLSLRYLVIASSGD